MCVCVCVQSGIGRADIWKHDLKLQLKKKFHECMNWMYILTIYLKSGVSTIHLSCDINKCDIIMEFLQSSHFFMSHYLFLQGSSPTERQLYFTLTTVIKCVSTKCMVKPQVVSFSYSKTKLHLFFFLGRQALY